MLNSLIVGADNSARRSPRGVVAPSREGARYTYDGEHELILTLGDVGERQVEAVRHGEAEFALLLDDPLILLGARFGDAGGWHWWSSTSAPLRHKSTGGGPPVPPARFKPPCCVKSTSAANQGRPLKRH